jgi:hypothetical protein
MLGCTVAMDLYNIFSSSHSHNTVTLKLSSLSLDPLPRGFFPRPLFISNVHTQEEKTDRLISLIQSRNTIPTPVTISIQTPDPIFQSFPSTMFLGASPQIKSAEFTTHRTCLILRCDLGRKVIWWRRCGVCTWWKMSERSWSWGNGWRR